MAPGTRCNADTSLTDIAATALSAADITAPGPAMEGENLLDIATGRGPDAPRDIFSQWNMTPFEKT